MRFLSKSEWNVFVKAPVLVQNASSAVIMSEDETDGRPYIQEYQVAVLIRRRVYWKPPRSKQSPKMMLMWTLSNYLCLVLKGFPDGGRRIDA